MKVSGKRLVAISLALMLAVILGGGGATVAVAQTDNLYSFGMDQSVLQPEMPKNYSSLPGLVAMVCDEAIEQFYDFFGPTQVHVEPFVVVGEFPPKRISVLGATLSDQMAAMINNNAVAQYIPEGRADYDQKVQGVLQEVDGLLRIHISGVNSGGGRRSYVINVEMSEPIYRAMHSYVGR